MEKNSRYRIWIAEQIGKSYLFETELLEVYPSDNDNYDFICLLKSNLQHRFAVEVKSSMYNKKQIFRVYNRTRLKFIDMQIPVLVLYINYIDKTGYFEFIYNVLTDDLLNLNTENLKSAINSLSFS